MIQRCFTLFCIALISSYAAADDDAYVTCGSAIKLTHVESSKQAGDNKEYYLNSESKNLGSGSGQQIVTAVTNPSTTNTLWWIRSANSGDKTSGRGVDDNVACLDGPGTQIKCGSIIRLTHLSTMRNLHSHEMHSPLSRQQEVTAFGDGDGLGDAGDDWTVICKGEYWKREEFVQFKHVDTQKYLGSSSTVKFTRNNCGANCPILNHLEVFGRSHKDSYANFIVEMGIHLAY